MIYGAKSIGNELLKIELVNEFREQYQKLNAPKKDLNTIQKFFMLNNSLSLQFDGFICLFANLRNESPEEVKNTAFEEFINTKCAPLAIISNLIVFYLNNHIIGGEVFNIIETPYDNIFNKNAVKNKAKFKKTFEIALKENIDDIFPLIISLREKFLKSKLYTCYINALKKNEDIKKYEINIQVLFYIIKQIIYQNIVYGQIKSINDDNIISLNHTQSLEGTFSKIKFQPSNAQNFSMDARDIIEIDHENKKDLGLVISKRLNITPEKGTIGNIEVEYLSEEGININSPSNDGINQFLNDFGHWYRFIDINYSGIQ